MDSVELDAKFISSCISALASHPALRGASGGRIHLGIHGLWRRYLVWKTGTIS